MKFPENGNCENPYRMRLKSTFWPPTRPTEIPMVKKVAKTKGKSMISRKSEN